jgi:hypothetical protein
LPPLINRNAATTAQKQLFLGMIDESGLNLRPTHVYPRHENANAREKRQRFGIV